MRSLPTEFSELLTPRGLRLLSTGKHTALARQQEEPSWRYVALTDVIDRKRAAGVLALLERAVGPHLSRMEQPIPPETILLQTQNYAEQLPKAVRVSTAMLDSRRSRAFKAAEEVGLVPLLRSESFGALAGVIARRKLRRSWGIQALRYSTGDYSGPHTDAHPEDPDARDGYFDMHLSLTGAAVAQQWIQYARAGHLSEVRPVNTLGGLAAYRLPFWHSVSPLVAKPGREQQAHRWVLLGTFLYAPGSA